MPGGAAVRPWDAPLDEHAAISARRASRWRRRKAVLVAAAYIAITSRRSASSRFCRFPAAWSEGTKHGTDLIGSVRPDRLVLLGAYLFGLEICGRSDGRTFSPSTPKAWTIAAIAAAIHIGTALLLFLPQPGRVWEWSGLNLILSVVPAADGWSQEVLFRGYVLLRLARAGVPALAQILMSGALFAAIHIGYVGEGAWDMLSPLVGTFMLGCFFAWAVQIGRGSLRR